MDPGGGWAGDSRVDLRSIASRLTFEWSDCWPDNREFVLFVCSENSGGVCFFFIILHCVCYFPLSCYVRYAV